MEAAGAVSAIDDEVRFLIIFLCLSCKEKLCTANKLIFFRKKAKIRDKFNALGLFGLMLCWHGWPC